MGKIRSSQSKVPRLRFGEIMEESFTDFTLIIVIGVTTLGLPPSEIFIIKI